MYGVFGKPWLNLDSLLPLDMLDEEEIAIELATSTKHSNSYGKGFARDMVNYLTCPPDASRKVQQFYAENAHRPEAITEFAKIYYKALAPTRVVRLAHMSPRLLSDLRPQFQHLVSDPTLWTPISGMFPHVREFIAASGAFKHVGRVHFLITDQQSATPEHIDSHHPLCGPARGYKAPADRQFLWIRMNQPKHFYVLDDEAGIRHEVTSKSAWFNTYDLHGGDPNPVVTWSLRIDGAFTDDFINKLRELANAS